MTAEREAALATAFSYRERGHPAEAERLYRALVAAAGAPKDRLYARALAGLGAAIVAQGGLEEAIAACEAAVGIAPDLAEANFNLAGAYVAANRTEDAVARYQEALAADPALIEAHYGLGVALALLKRPQEAVAAYEKALAIDADFAEAACALGTVLHALGRHEDSLRRFEQALDVDPDYADARLGQAASLRALKRDAEAVTAYDRLLALEPNNAAAHHGRALALFSLQRHDEAVESFTRAAQLRPDNAQIAHELAGALEAATRHDEAIVACERAIAIDPTFAAAHGDLGALLVMSGRIDEAKAAYTKAVTLEPRNAVYHSALAGLGKISRDDPLLLQMETLARDIASLSDLDQVSLHFALGKAYAGCGEHDRSFEHYLKGGALKRQSLAYDERQVLGLMERITQVFSPALIAARSGKGDPSPVPVFIIGMPRSGTTLAEQILASHPQLFGAGERNIMKEAAGSRYPESVPWMTDREFKAVGESYVAKLAALAPGVTRVSDKLPNNFHYVGLIRLALPNARIIHMRRDPIDTCLSCFMTRFKGDNIPYSYDLAELGRFYRAYAALMAHWRAVLGPDGFLDVDYEELVDDVEGQARRIVSYCGLPWNDACLAFYETKREVRTASAVQVRQPIYRTSVGRWRPPDSVLMPLLDKLAARGA
ncbi:MAG TPA: sulfotransferase [Stellaceae bacterium]|nr:sulfotransferase [Stellaceae bacterium]